MPASVSASMPLRRRPMSASPESLRRIRLYLDSGICEGELYQTKEESPQRPACTDEYQRGGKISCHPERRHSGRDGLPPMVKLLGALIEIDVREVHVLL